LEKAQTRVEGHHFDIRKHLVEYDDVMNKQRSFIYKKRDDILRKFEKEPEKLKDLVWEMIKNEIDQIVSFHTADPDQTKWNLKEIAETAKTMFPAPDVLDKQLESLEKVAGDKSQDAVSRTAIIEHLEKIAKEEYDKLTEQINETGREMDISMPMVEKEIMIRSIDNLWVDHLDALDSLRTGIGLRGYGQRDPLIEYKKESRTMFDQLLNLINRQVVYSIFKVGLVKPDSPGMMDRQQANYYAPAKTADSTSSTFSQKMSDPYEQAKQKHKHPVGDRPKDAAGKKIGRNDPCPCGSGKKYKKCCG
jgi:preprotein translocase subunit SecA